MEEARDIDGFEEWLNRVSNQAYGEIISLFSDKPGVFIVGGSLRDYFMGSCTAPKDLDVPVLGVTTEELMAIPGARKDFFGEGVSLRVAGMDVDVWPLQECIAVKRFGLPCSIEGFLVGALFNLEKIAFDVGKKRLHDLGCRDGIARRIIEYNPYQPYLEHIQAVRLVLLAKKTGFVYGSSAKALLVRGGVLLEDEKNWSEAVRFFGAKPFAALQDAKSEIQEFCEKGP